MAHPKKTATAFKLEHEAHKASEATETLYDLSSIYTTGDSVLTQSPMGHTAAVNKVTATMDPMTAGNQSTVLAQSTSSDRSTTSVRNASLEEEGK